MSKLAKAEKDDLFERVVELGCIICQSPAEIHHCFTSMGCKKDDSEVIPLCPAHHRNGGYGRALHAGKKAFEKTYGTEKELRDKTMRLINV